MTQSTTGSLTTERIARFWGYVERRDPNECWSWQGWINGKGRNAYGRFFLGQIDGKNKYMTAHRLAYELLVGPIPEGLVPDHLCRNKLCVNPAHLEPVTVKENTLRGIGITAQRARQTHCKRGHELSGDNLAKCSYYRLCKTCRQEYQKTRKRRVANG